MFGWIKDLFPRPPTVFLDQVPWENFTESEVIKDVEKENQRRLAEGKEALDPPSVRYAKKREEARKRHGKELVAKPIIYCGLPRE